MSLQDAKKFAEKFKNEKSFRDQLKSAESDEAKKKFASDMGLSFTVEELQEALGGSSELSDEDLDAVAGGSSATWAGVSAGGVAAAASCGW